MQKQREERRRRAEAAKNKRAEEAKDAEDKGGIESVDFLRKIKMYRVSNGLTEEATRWDMPHVWSTTESSRIRVCVRKRPMLRRLLLTTVTVPTPMMMTTTMLGRGALLLSTVILAVGSHLLTLFRSRL